MHEELPLDPGRPDGPADDAAGPALPAPEQLPFEELLTPGAGEEDEEEDFAEALRQALADRDANLAAQAAENRVLLERLRQAFLATDPAVEPELVRATSIGELEASFAAAKAVVERVRREVMREVAASVPAGAPGRLGAVPTSALEQIRAGLRRAG